MEKSKMNRKIEMNRREFVAGATRTIVIVAIAARFGRVAYADGRHDPAHCEIIADLNVLRVTPGPSHVFPKESHRHHVEIPLEMFKNPPEEGIRLLSTESPYPFRHQHIVALSKRKLLKIADGNTVTLFDRNFDHTWVIRLA